MAQPPVAVPAAGVDLRPSGRLASATVELLLLAAAIAGLEVLGRWLPASDLAALGLLVLGVGPLAWAGAGLARRGRLPLCTALGGALAAGLRRLVDAAVPRYELALRLAPGQRLARDPALLLPLLGVALLTTAAVLGGPHLAPGLAWVRASLSVTLWVLGLCLLWGLLLLLVAAAFALQVRALGPWMAITVTLVSLAPALLVPAPWLTAAVLALGLVQSLRLARRPLPPYVFTRTGRRGELRGVRAQTLLRRMHLLCTLGLACALTLGTAQRLPGAEPTAAQYPFTFGLGLLASLACVLLAVRVDLHFGRLLWLRRPAPEVPLDLTLACSAPRPFPPHVAAAAQHGWRVVSEAAPLPDGVDLVTGPGMRGPHAVALEPGMAPADLAFRLRRRMDIAYRREFYARLEALWKAMRPARQLGGQGVLFCPGNWLIPCLLRDTGRSATPIGPPYDQVFSPRLRRYLAGVMRHLEVDVIYWEDAVRWRDLRRVLGVALECHDQGRVPLRARHFVGLPRVRVLVQQEDPPGMAGAPASARMPRAPIGSGARVLAILRDRGGSSERTLLRDPGSQRPAPSPLAG
ncbi:MAG: hypothetical protein ACKOCB_03015 [Planctomycetia bacterium]